MCAAVEKRWPDKKQLCNESAAESLRHNIHFWASLFNQKTNYNRVLMKMPINFVKLCS
jgi:hypothetical protein